MPGAMSIIQNLATAPHNAATAPTYVRVLLLAPYGAAGGGMGRMMDYLAECQTDGMRLVRVETRGAGSAADSIWYTLYAGMRIAGAAAGAVPTIVHINMAERGSIFRKSLLLLLARALGLPAVLHLHAAELIDSTERLPRVLQRLTAVPFRAATVCIVLGTLWRDYLRDELGVPENRIEILHNGVPRPVLRRFPAPSGTFNFVFLGNLQKRKGLTDLLHALSDPALLGFDWCLTIAGSGDTTRLRELATILGIGARISFTGWLDRDGTTSVLARANALVLPSYAEGLPLALLEAASLGVPIVATPVGAIGEVFTDCETALLVPPGNRHALTAALHLLLAEPHCAPRLGRLGRELYARELTLAGFVLGLRSIYRRHCQHAAAAWQDSATVT
jgi:glycosyltransferase involved in cell wall biosynthesis